MLRVEWSKHRAFVVNEFAQIPFSQVFVTKERTSEGNTRVISYLLSNEGICVPYGVPMVSIAGVGVFTKLVSVDENGTETWE